MKTKLITLQGRTFLVGYGLAPEGIPGEAFILEKVGLKIKALYQNFFGLPTMEKRINTRWFEISLVPETIEAMNLDLMPLPSYFDAATKTVIPEFSLYPVDNNPSDSFGKLPGTDIFKYDAYASMPTASGDNLHTAIFRTCLAVYFEVEHGVKIVDASGELIQPEG